MAIDGKMIALIAGTAVLIVISIGLGGYSRQPMIGACFAFITSCLLYTSPSPRD